MEAAEAVVSWKDLATAARRRAVRTRVWLLVVPLCLMFLLLAVLVDVLVVRALGAVLVVYVGTVPLWGPTVATFLQARHRPLPPRPTRWTVTEAGVSVESEGRQSALPWATLTDASAWRRGVSLRFGRAVAFIPSRAFQSPEHQASFIATAQARLAPAAASPTVAEPG